MPKGDQNARKEWCVGCHHHTGICPLDEKIKKSWPRFSGRKRERARVLADFRKDPQKVREECGMS